MRGLSQRLRSHMQPEVAAQTLQKVEDNWLLQATNFLRCSDAHGDCSEDAKAFESSCERVVASVVSGSSGDRSVVAEYMSDVCGEASLQDWHRQDCQRFAASLTSAMSLDVAVNRDHVDLQSVCKSVWTNFRDDAKDTVEKEKKEREAAEQRAAEEKAQLEKEEAEQRAAAEKEAAERAAAEKDEAEKRAAAEQEAEQRAAAEREAAERATEEKEAAQRAAAEKVEAESNQTNLVASPAGTAAESDAVDKVAAPGNATAVIPDSSTRQVEAAPASEPSSDVPAAISPEAVPVVLVNATLPVEVSVPAEENSASLHNTSEAAGTVADSVTSTENATSHASMDAANATA